MMIIFETLIGIVEMLIFICVLVDLIHSIRNEKYQKLWNREKAMRLGATPRISNAELCEQYVMFCKRNGCKVEY